MSRMIPAIRFKGYTDDWEQCRLIDGCDYVDYRGKTPTKTEDGIFLVTAKNVKDGYIDYETSQEYIAEEDYDDVMHRGMPQIGDVLITTEAPCGNVAQVDREDIALAQRIIKYRGHEKQIDNTYLKHYLLTPYFQRVLGAKSSGGTVQGIKGSILHQQIIRHPSFNEQVKIGRHLDNIDNLITLHQRKCDALKTLKKGMLQKMFPKNGAKIPEFRFKGFTGDWEQRKLGEFYQKNTERNTDLIGYDKTISIATMTYKDEGNGASDDSLAGYKVLRVGDIAFEGHTNKQFRYGRFVVNDIGTGIMSPRFTTLRPKKEMTVAFWKYYIHYEPIMRKVLVNATKAGTMMNELVVPEFLEQSVNVPSEEEQERIGTYFANLDSLITLHQRKSDALKELKKGMLQKMFPEVSA